MRTWEHILQYKILLKMNISVCENKWKKENKWKYMKERNKKDFFICTQTLYLHNFTPC